MDAKNCSLIISTYNWPRALELSLESIREQTILPNEVLIADDGSNDDTKILIEKFTKTFPTEIIHIWQEDKGFRRCHILNKAISRARFDYIIQTDGDCILSRHFIEDHLKISRKNFFTCGSRTLISQKLSEKLLREREREREYFCVFSRN